MLLLVFRPPVINRATKINLGPEAAILMRFHCTLNSTEHQSVVRCKYLYTIWPAAGLTSCSGLCALPSPMESGKMFPCDGSSEMDN